MAVSMRASGLRPRVSPGPKMDWNSFTWHPFCVLSVSPRPGHGTKHHRSNAVGLARADGVIGQRAATDPMTDLPAGVRHLDDRGTFQQLVHRPDHRLDIQAIAEEREGEEREQIARVADPGREKARGPAQTKRVELAECRDIQAVAT